MVKIKNIKSLSFGLKEKGGRNSGTIACQDVVLQLKGLTFLRYKKNNVKSGHRHSSSNRYMYDPNDQEKYPW